MSNSIAIQLSDGSEIVVEKYKAGEDFPEEFVIYLKDEDGIITQDICLIRSHYEYKDNKSCINESLIDCLIWSDEYNEDYTHKFIIPKYVIDIGEQQ